MTQPIQRDRLLMPTNWTDADTSKTAVPVWGWPEARFSTPEDLMRRFGAPPVAILQKNQIRRGPEHHPELFQKFGDVDTWLASRQGPGSRGSPIVGLSPQDQIEIWKRRLQKFITGLEAMGPEASLEQRASWIYEQLYPKGSFMEGSARVQRILTWREIIKNVGKTPEGGALLARFDMLFEESELVDMPVPSEVPPPVVPVTEILPPEGLPAKVIPPPDAVLSVIGDPLQSLKALADSDKIDEQRLREAYQILGGNTAQTNYDMKCHIQQKLIRLSGIAFAKEDWERAHAFFDLRYALYDARVRSHGVWSPLEAWYWKRKLASLLEVLEIQAPANLGGRRAFVYHFLKPRGKSEIELVHRVFYENVGTIFFQFTQKDPEFMSLFEQLETLIPWKKRQALPADVPKQLGRPKQGLDVVESRFRTIENQMRLNGEAFQRVLEELGRLQAHSAETEKERKTSEEQFREQLTALKVTEEQDPTRLKHLEDQLAAAEEKNRASEAALVVAQQEVERLQEQVRVLEAAVAGAREESADLLYPIPQAEFSYHGLALAEVRQILGSAKLSEELAALDSGIELAGGFEEVAGNFEALDEELMPFVPYAALVHMGKIHSSSEDAFFDATYTAQASWESYQEALAEIIPDSKKRPNVADYFQLMLYQAIEAPEDQVTLRAEVGNLVWKNVEIPPKWIKKAKQGFGDIPLLNQTWQETMRYLVALFGELNLELSYLEEGDYGNDAIPLWRLLLLPFLERANLVSEDNPFLRTARQGEEAMERYFQAQAKRIDSLYGECQRQATMQGVDEKRIESEIFQITAAGMLIKATAQRPELATNPHVFLWKWPKPTRSTNAADPGTIRSVSAPALVPQPTRPALGRDSKIFRQVQEAARSIAMEQYGFEKTLAYSDVFTEYTLQFLSDLEHPYEMSKTKIHQLIYPFWIRQVVIPLIHEILSSWTDPRTSLQRYAAKHGAEYQARLKTIQDELELGKDGSKLAKEFLEKSSFWMAAIKKPILRDSLIRQLSLVASKPHYPVKGVVDGGRPTIRTNTVGHGKRDTGAFDTPSATDPLEIATPGNASDQTRSLLDGVFDTPSLGSPQMITFPTNVGIVGNTLVRQKPKPALIRPHYRARFYAPRLFLTRRAFPFLK